MSRVILHCDMNNFFASVECLIDPTLKDKCIAVCGDKKERRGIVLAKNEAAKKFGVITAEPIWQAQRKCPDLIIVSPHYEYYSYYSERAKDIYLEYTDLVEPFGIDACWLYVTGSIKLFGSGESIAEKIRNRVRNELGLTVSIGVSFNKVFAKLGSDMKKPDAVTVISKENYKDKIYKLPASDLMGIGKSAKERLHGFGVDTIGELAEMSLETLKYRLGKSGEILWQYANALDNSPVLKINYTEPAKSIGHGTTTVYDLSTDEAVKRLIIALCIPISYKLRRQKQVAGGVQVAVRDCSLVTRDFQCVLSRETNDASELAKEAYALFKKRYDWHSNIHSLTVRAINLSDSTDCIQLDMLHDEKFFERNERINKTVDKISERYGKSSIMPMILLDYKP